MAISTPLPVKLKLMDICVVMGIPLDTCSSAILYLSPFKTTTPSQSAIVSQLTTIPLYKDVLRITRSNLERNQPLRAKKTAIFYTLSSQTGSHIAHDVIIGKTPW